MHRSHPRRGLAVCSLPLLLLLAAGPARAADGMGSLGEKVEELVLDNGMRFLLMKRGEAPVFHGLIRFHVGGVDEVPGITGLAHLFEHMAFKGTTRIGTTDHEGEAMVLEAIDEVARAQSAEKARWDKADPRRLELLEAQMKALQELHKKYVVKDEFTSFYTKNGGKGLNATTSKDFTTYFVSVPSNRMELWMLLESERLVHPVLREFYSERDVVQEERRMRTDDDPGGKLYEQFLAAAFSAHPYRFPTVGWASDIATVTKKEARAFYDTYYSPRNAVGALVGNFDVGEAKRLLRRYFSRLENKGALERPRTREPEQKGERRVKVYFDAQPDMMIGWHKPTLPHPDEYVFDVLEQLLTEGRTSRLYKRLVVSGKAQGVWAYTVPGSRYPNVFVLSATPMAGHTVEEMEAELLDELETLKTELVDPRELQKVVNQVEAGFLRALRSNQGMADALTRYQLLTGDWRTLSGYVDELRKVTPERVREIVRRYFVTTNQTVGQLRKKSELASTGEGGEG